jgi:capsid assembly protease
VLDNLESTLWLMEPGRLIDLQKRLARVKEWPSPKAIAQARAQEKSSMRQRAGRIGVINIGGVIEQHFSAISALFGGTATEDIADALQEMVAASDVQAIVLRIDSPGGGVYGVEALSNLIAEARKSKTVISVADSLMASAALWIGSSASQVYATPGGEAGSLGVYALHVDYSQALADDGITVTLTVSKSSPYKAEFAEFAPLTTEAKDYLQASVDEVYGKFAKAVARNRGVSVATVQSRYGGGRVLSADKALSAGLIDGIVPFRDVLAQLMSGKPVKGISRASVREEDWKPTRDVEVLRRRQAFRKMRDADLLTR